MYALWVGLTSLSRAPPWMSLEDLLNKLLFMAVCDDGKAIHYFRCAFSLSTSCRSGVHLPLPSNISTLCKSANPATLYAEADEIA